jgi:hypothetical protein
MDLLLFRNDRLFDMGDMSHIRDGQHFMRALPSLRDQPYNIVCPRIAKPKFRGGNWARLWISPYIGQMSVETTPRADPREGTGHIDSRPRKDKATTCYRVVA